MMACRKESTLSFGVTDWKKNELESRERDKKIHKDQIILGIQDLKETLHLSWWLQWIKWQKKEEEEAYEKNRKDITRRLHLGSSLQQRLTRVKQKSQTSEGQEGGKKENVWRGVKIVLQYTENKGYTECKVN